MNIDKVTKYYNENLDDIGKKIFNCSDNERFWKLLASVAPEQLKTKYWTTEEYKTRVGNTIKGEDITTINNEKLIEYFTSCKPIIPTVLNKILNKGKEKAEEEEWKILEIFSGNGSASTIFTNIIKPGVLIKKTDLYEYEGVEQKLSYEAVRQYRNLYNILLVISAPPDSKFADYFAYEEIFNQKNEIPNSIKTIVIIGDLGVADGSAGIVPYYFNNNEKFNLEYCKHFEIKEEIINEHNRKIIKGIYIFSIVSPETPPSSSYSLKAPFISSEDTGKKNKRKRKSKNKSKKRKSSKRKLKKKSKRKSKRKLI